MNQTTLLRYNFRILMFHNWWLLVFPLAGSQLVVFWNILTQPFSPRLPALTVEIVSPLLAAFLSAHLLSAEYRSRIGAIVASKPVSIDKVVLLRLAVALGLVWALAALSLVAYYFGMEPYNIGLPVLACVPSTLFLALFALTFATLFRNALAGFGVAALYWALDLPPGPPLHPYLSLRSLASALTVPELTVTRAFVDQWWIAKIVLFLAALLLYRLHGGLLFTLGTPLTLRRRRQALAGAATVLAFYLVSGAVLKVVYGYSMRGCLAPNDAVWFRQQFAPYGPLPVASLFGPAFTRYLGELSNPWRLQQEETSLAGDTVAHRRALQTVVEKMADSLWAPSAAELLARLEAPKQDTLEAEIAYYRRIVERYGYSPYLPFGLRQMARAYAEAGRDEEARAAYQELLSRCPGSVYRSEALRYMMESDRRRKDLVSAVRWAQEWARAAPVQERFKAYLALAEILKEMGKGDEVRQAVQQTLEAVQAFRRAARGGTLGGTPGQRVTWEHEANAAEGRAKRF